MKESKDKMKALKDKQDLHDEIKKAGFTIQKKKNKNVRPDLWDYKKKESKHFIEGFKNEIQSDLYFKDNKYIGIVFIGDLHFGNKGVDYDRAENHARLINKTANCYGMLTGDYIDNFVNVKIKAAMVNKNTAPSEELALFETYLNFFVDSVILAIRGNHDAWMKEVAGVDLFKSIFKKGRILYSDDEHICNMVVSKVKYIVAMRHKYKFNSSFNITHTVKQWFRMGHHIFDVGVVSHQHEYAMESFFSKGDHRLAIRTGSYKVADVFARKIGFNPAIPIMPMVIFSPNEKKMFPHLYIEDGIKHLKELNK